MSCRDQVNHTAVQTLIDKLESKLENSNNNKNEPSTEYEKFRRRVLKNTEQFWNFISFGLNAIKKNVSFNKPELVDKITNVMTLGAEHKRSLISDMDEMRMVDGYEQWRQDEYKSLSDLVWRRLEYLQNPKDRKKARTLVCNLNPAICGYGCELHHINYCFILAYATERTLILNSNFWPYDKFPWDDLFQPVSETCLNIDPNASAEQWPAKHDTQVLNIQVDNACTSQLPYLPLSIPSDLAPRLVRSQGDPGAWWVGQLLKYLVRPRKATREIFETRMKKLGFKKPIVGVQIRRTDKKKEAAYYSVEEYMTYVEDYFLKLEMNGTNIKRRVFIATDEKRVIIQARKKYPSYEIIADTNTAKIAGKSRHTNESLEGIISDVYMLSSCDYLVCTFSSNICRTAYEIMHTIYPDAWNRVQSVDDIYYYVKENTHYSEAVISHHPLHHKEMDLKLGDQIEILIKEANNHRGGYSEGKNTRTNQTGLIPLFKVNDKFGTVKLPTYANVK